MATTKRAPNGAGTTILLGAGIVIGTSYKSISSTVKRIVPLVVTAARDSTCALRAREAVEDFRLMNELLCSAPRVRGNWSRRTGVLLASVGRAVPDGSRFPTGKGCAK